MEKWFDTVVPRILADLSPARFVFPKRAAAPRERPRTRGPVPIPFYGGPAAHSHDHVEIAVVLEGPLYCEIEGRGGTVEPGSVILFPPRVLHYDSYVSRKTAYTVLWFILWPGRPRANLSRYTPKGGFELLTLCEMRYDLVAQDDWAFVASFSRNHRPPFGRLRELLFALYAATIEAIRRSGPIGRQDVSRKVVSDAVAFLRDHLSESPTVEMAASYVGLSPTYLTTVVRKELGRPLHDVLAGMRFEKAKELLAGSRLSIKEIAHLCGFSAADYFSRAFRGVIGVSPRQFRNRPGRP